MVIQYNCQLNLNTKFFAYLFIDFQLFGQSFYSVTNRNQFNKCFDDSNWCIIFKQQQNSFGPRIYRNNGAFSKFHANDFIFFPVGVLLFSLVFLVKQNLWPRMIEFKE